MTAPIAAVDTETSGIHPGRQAYEVAVIRREPDGTETEWHAFLPIDLSTADPFGLRIGRFYDRHPTGRRLANPPGVKTGPLVSLKQAALDIARLTHGARIIGAVPHFDTEVLDRLLRDHGYLPGWDFRLVDVESLTAGHLHRHVGGLVRCAEALGITVGTQHEALADARLALDIYDTVITAHTTAEAA